MKAVFWPIKLQAAAPFPIDDRKLLRRHTVQSVCAITLQANPSILDYLYGSGLYFLVVLRRRAGEIRVALV